MSSCSLNGERVLVLFYFVINTCTSHVIITLICYFLIPKSRDLVSHNPGISGLINGPGSRDLGSRGIRDPGIAIPNLAGWFVFLVQLFLSLN